MQYGIEILPSHTITKTERRPFGGLHGAFDGAYFHGEIVNGAAGENEC